MNLVFVGTYTNNNNSEGVYTFRMDPATGAWTRLPQTALPRIANPSYLALDAPRHRLFAVSEVSDGQVIALRYDSDTAALTLVNQQSSVGKDPCHLSVEKSGRYVLVANYSSGTFSLLPVAGDGSLRPPTDTARDQGTGPNKMRQEAPHAHSINFDPSGTLAYGCDLGIDRIQIFHPDSRSGKLVANEPPFIAVQPGAGPRHFAFHPKKRFAYAINELDCTITAFSFEPKSGVLTALQTISTLPRPLLPTDTCADIHVSPDGKFLYGSNRGHDSIALFAIDGNSGKLTALGHESTQGKTPRNFALDPTGNFLYAANQNSDSIIAYRIDKKTGKLMPTGQRIDVPSPVCIVFEK